MNFSLTAKAQKESDVINILGSVDKLIKNLKVDYTGGSYSVYKDCWCEKNKTVIDITLSDPTEYENTIDRENNLILTEINDSLPLFPLLSNKAQRDAAIKADTSKLMAIQWPPGTGKSQTIVNLICHLVAKDKSVLVTSHQNKAIEELIRFCQRWIIWLCQYLKMKKNQLMNL